MDASGLLSLYYCVTCVGYLVLLFRWRMSRPVLGLLVSAIFFTWGTLYEIAMAFLAFQRHSFLSGVSGALATVFAAVNLAMAQLMWDRWNRRRKRKGRVTGKVGLRLGKFVIIPEA